MKESKNIFYIAIGFLVALLVGYFLVAKHIIIVPQAVELFFVISFSALLDSLNPCAFSILFLTIGFLFSLGRDRAHVFKAGLMYVFGIMATYVLIGLGILRVLSFFDVPNGMAKFGALAIIVFGAIGLINEFFPKFPIKLKIPHAAHTLIAKYIEKATMRLIEVGTKLFSDGKKDEAKEMYERAHKLFSIFWALRLKLIDLSGVKALADEEKPWTLKDITNRLVDCCKE